MDGWVGHVGQPIADSLIAKLSPIQLAVCTTMFPFWILLELRMMEVVVTTGAIRRAKLQSKCHHQQTNTRFFTGRMPFLSPNQQCQSTEGKGLLVDPAAVKICTCYRRRFVRRGLKSVSYSSQRTVGHWLETTDLWNDKTSSAFDRHCWQVTLLA